MFIICFVLYVGVCGLLLGKDWTEVFSEQSKDEFDNFDRASWVIYTLVWPLALIVMFLFILLPERTNKKQ